MKLRTSRILSPSAGKACSTSTGTTCIVISMMRLIIYRYRSHSNFHFFTFYVQSPYNFKNVMSLFTIFPLNSLSSMQSEAIVAHWYPSPEQSNGALVSYALPHAACFPVPSWVQGVVLKPAHWHDWREPGVQRGLGQTTSQGSTSLWIVEDV